METHEGGMLMNCRSAHIFAAGGLDESKSRSQDLVNSLPESAMSKFQKYATTIRRIVHCFHDEIDMSCRELVASSRSPNVTGST
ncbi:UNVERIFIED_CONTAM: hypothetical protein K2H54_061039 [Gekko kuhli]